MAIADTVWGRISRFNRPRRRTVEPLLSQRDDTASPWSLVGAIRHLRWLALLVVLGVLGWAASVEMRTSHYQATFFSRLARNVAFNLEPGPSDAISFPKAGPYDERLGYAGMPDFLSSLSEHHFAIDSQARWSPGLTKLVSWGAFPVYSEKPRAGLRIFDRNHAEIFKASVPQNAYPDFASVPPLVVNSLLFIEDRYLFDAENPERNAAVEWNRFFLAAGKRIASIAVPHLRSGGGSTLATQIEKFRHSSSGRTDGVGEKLRQMLTASARVYSDGPNTMKRREQIVTSYLNSAPLSSRPGYGEVLGIPDALWVWFGTDFRNANQILKSAPRNAAELARKAEVYRQVVALLVADRSPSTLLLNDRQNLNTLTDKHLRVLCDAGVIEPELRDAALAAPLRFREEAPPVASISFVQQKATQEMRAKLMNLLHLPNLYVLDRLDLSAETTVDTETQARVANVLQQLSNPAVLRGRGMVGDKLLGSEDPSKVTYSFVLYERGPNRNLLRIHADSLNQPFDINSGAKLQLGSTAKLRTMATYLTIVEQLHRRLAQQPAKQLAAVAASAYDPLTTWAASYLARASDRSLQPMLDAAMQRHYSASPGSFFTGGGIQSFGNFESWEDSENPTVEDAFHHSVNLSFVRLLNDVATYYGTFGGRKASPLLDPNNPDREEYLRRFVDQDSRRFLHRFLKQYRNLSAEEAEALLLRRTRPIPSRLATVYLTLHPDARLAEFKQFMLTHLPRGALDENKIWELYIGYSPEKLSLKDRAYVAGIHPLELWLVTYLQEHPGAARNDVMEASAPVREEVYTWLLKGSAHKQDIRIKLLMEQDAFAKIWQVWRAQGYPFGHLVPSLGTAIGASGDRPDALAELLGIILNDGMRLPSVSIERLHFATDTPYETNLSAGKPPERVMSHEVALTLKRALTGVVTNGTASRLRGTYQDGRGTPLEVGGKTGTGDNRYDHFAAGGGIISSRVVDRTATFVFYIGDRFFGTVTAYVPGADAARYHFTSALAVQLLKSLEPELRPLIQSPPGEPTTLVPTMAVAVGSSTPPAIVTSTPARR